MVEILDVAAFTEVLSERGLHRGQVGTVVEAPAPDVFEIEFSDGEGRAYASLAANAGQPPVLRYERLRLASLAAACHI